MVQNTKFVFPMEIVMDGESSTNYKESSLVQAFFKHALGKIDRYFSDIKPSDRDSFI